MFRGLLDTYIAAQFVRILSTPWKDMPAFKLGIIDERGNILRPRKSLTTNDEKAAYTMFHRLVWNIKRLIEGIPGGSTRIGSLAAALYLLKESTGNKMVDPSILVERTLDFIEEQGLDIRGIGLSETIVDDVLPAGTYYTAEHDLFNLVSEDISPVDTIFGVPVYSHDGYVFTREDTMTSGIDMTDKPLTFAGTQVYTVSPEVFHKCRLGKRKFDRYDKYVGNDETGEKIRSFGRTNPKHGIILKDAQTASMLFLRRPAT